MPQEIASSRSYGGLRGQLPASLLSAFLEQFLANILKAARIQQTGSLGEAPLRGDLWMGYLFFLRRASPGVAVGRVSQLQKQFPMADDQLFFVGLIGRTEELLWQLYVF